MIALQDALRRLDACHNARFWVGDRDLATAWRECARGDWMLWLAARAGVDRRLVVEAACDCAETALVHVPAGEDRPRAAIETARRWARGEATAEAAIRATYAATYAAAYADDDVVAYAAYAAAAVEAALVAHESVDDAAHYAADAAMARAADADAADADAAAAASLARSADLVRARIPYESIAAALEAE